MTARAGFERLWSPWRMAYVAGVAPVTAAARSRRAAGPIREVRSVRSGRGRRPRHEECLFCRVAASTADRENLVVLRRPHALLMLNRYPYNPAHLMIAVRRHAPGFGDLDAGERADLLDLTALAERALEAEYRPDGINAGANLGRVAGAGFPGHLHLHLVPRWNGDTNFMPVIASTRVLSETLGRTWTRLRRAVKALDAPARRR